MKKLKSKLGAKLRMKAAPDTKRRTPKGERCQVGALPVRPDGAGGFAVLLVTSRQTKRWVVPKGWPMRGRKDRKAAAIEAKQEAGVLGRVTEKPVGSYLYWKRKSRTFELCRVEVYGLLVERELTRWKEKGQRKTGWFQPTEAAGLVQEAGLAALIESFSLDLGAFPPVKNYREAKD